MILIVFWKCVGSTVILATAPASYRILAVFISYRGNVCILTIFSYNCTVFVIQNFDASNSQSKNNYPAFYPKKSIFFMMSLIIDTHDLCCTIAVTSNSEHHIILGKDGLLFIRILENYISCISIVDTPPLEFNFILFVCLRLRGKCRIIPILHVHNSNTTCIHWPLPRGNRCLSRPPDPPNVRCDPQSSVHKRLPGSCMTRISSPRNTLSDTVRSLTWICSGWDDFSKLFRWNDERNSKLCSDLSTERKNSENQMERVAQDYCIESLPIWSNNELTLHFWRGVVIKTFSSNHPCQIQVWKAGTSCHFSKKLLRESSEL